MRDLRNHVRLALGALASVLVISPLGNAAYDFYREVAPGAVPWLGSALGAIGLLSIQSWFPWLAGLVIGLLAGVWLDSALKRLEMRSGDWLTIEEAAETLSAPGTIRDRDSMEATVGVLDTERLRLMGELNNIPAKSVRDVRFGIGMSDLEKSLQADLMTITAELIGAQQKLRDLNAQRYVDVIGRLERGELAAKAFVPPTNPDSKEMPIPKEQWRLLRFSYPHDAEGGGLRYSGVRIRKMMDSE